ncbi:MAG: hypothetical protein AAB453_01480 [Patescibacteria group bacterium]
MKNKGFIALITVIVLSAALLAVGLGASFSGLAQVTSGYQFSRGEEARVLAEGCLEATLLNLRSNANYGLPPAPINLSLSAGSCIINVVSTGASTRQITITAKVDNEYYRYFTASISLLPEQVLLTSLTDGE